MTTVKYWKYWCNTESAYVYMWSPTKPTVCANNNAHTIAAEDYKFLVQKTVSEAMMSVKEQEVPTAGCVQCTQIKWAVPASIGTHVLKYTAQTKPINVLSAAFVSATEHKNDRFDVVVGHRTIIGVITADVNVSDTIINVSSTVLQNVYLGEIIRLQVAPAPDIPTVDQTGDILLGEVTAKDEAGGTITVETGASEARLAATPTYVLKSNYFVKDFTIGFPWRYEVGADKIGGSYVPTGTVIQFHYYNSDGVAKDFYAQYDYLYG